MKSYVKHVLIIALLTGIVCPLHSADSWYPSADTLKRYGLPVGLGAVAGSGLGYGAGRYMGYDNPWQLALLAALAGASASGVYQHSRTINQPEQLKEASQSQPQQQEGSFSDQKMRRIVESIKEHGIRGYFIAPSRIAYAAGVPGDWDYNIEQNPLNWAGLEQLVEEVIDFYQRDRIDISYLRILNEAFIDSLKSQDRFFVTILADEAIETTDQHIAAGKKVFLSKLINLYADPTREKENQAEKKYIFSRGGDIDSKIDRVSRYLEDHNKFGARELFFATSIKSAKKK